MPFRPWSPSSGCWLGTCWGERCSSRWCSAGGAGQYAVQAIVNSDFAAIQGFVLVAAAFSLLVYLAVDLLYFAMDPRIRP